MSRAGSRRPRLDEIHRQRLLSARERVNICTLGSAALAGTSLPIDRHWVAEQLGFEGISANSLDSSSDRDFAAETTFALAMIALHLSTWAEEWILWSSVEFGFLQLPQAFCTGSSIMPHKMNPDVLELTRGKSGRVVGDLNAILTLLTGLPLAYNRDLQEDKPPLFDAVDTVKACLQLAVPVVAGSELRADNIRSRLEEGHLDATTLMELLIRNGVPQRTAHHAVGQLVNRALQLGVALADLPDEEYEQLNLGISPSIKESLGVSNAVAAFVSHGSTSPEEVDQQIDSWRERLGIESGNAT